MYNVEYYERLVKLKDFPELYVDVPSDCNDKFWRNMGNVDLLNYHVSYYKSIDMVAFYVRGGAVHRKHRLPMSWIKMKPHPLIWIKHKGCGYINVSRASIRYSEESIFLNTKHTKNCVGKADFKSYAALLNYMETEPMNLHEKFLTIEELLVDALEWYELQNQ